MCAIFFISIRPLRLSISMRVWYGIVFRIYVPVVFYNDDYVVPFEYWFELRFTNVRFQRHLISSVNEPGSCRRR